MANRKKMIKKTNTRVMVTLSETTEKMLNEIAQRFSMNKSGAMNMIIVLFHNERMNK